MVNARPNVDKIRSILNYGLSKDDPNLAKNIVIRDFEYDMSNNRDCLKVELQIQRYHELYTYIVNNDFYKGDDDNTGSDSTIYVYFETNNYVLGKHQRLV